MSNQIEQGRLESVRSVPLLEHPLSGRRVLIIEDESMVTMLIEDTLADIGCEVAGTASRLDEARKKASSLCFDVVILDVNLNGRHTYAVAEILIRRGIPFLFATGYDNLDLPEPFRDVPILAKPFRERDLEEALLAALKVGGSNEG
jgi:CheY-like chemotaxis protein